MLPVGNPVDTEGALLGIRDASYICLVTLVLILYDHILTFRVELASFWTLGLTWLRCLFFLNRYLSIILAAIQLYSITSEELSASVSYLSFPLGELSNTNHAIRRMIITYTVDGVLMQDHRCAGLNAFITYGTVIIVTFSFIVQFIRVYVLYKPQRRVIYALVASMLILCGTCLGFVVTQERALIFLDDSLPAIGSGCRGCRSSDGGANPWTAMVPLLIQQTILTGMILFKGFTTPAKGEHVKGVMGVVMRDGAIVYLVILLTVTICFLGVTVKSLEIPLSISPILLPVFSICTTRLLVNLRGGPHGHPNKHHNDLFGGVEMSGLYLGGYLGGIAPARGVEGAIVTEIGNTTIIEVPVVDLEDARGGPSRCGERPGTITTDEGGGGGFNGRPRSDCHASMAVSPPLKVSALGATPGWEHWDHRLPTKDFKLPSSSSSSPPQERGLHFEDNDDGDEGGARNPFVDRDVLQQRRTSARNSSARRRSQNRASDRRGSGRSNSTVVSTAPTVATITAGAGAGGAPIPPSSIPSTSETERPGTSGTQRTLVHKSSNYAGWPSSSDDGKGKPPLQQQM